MIQTVLSNINEFRNQLNKIELYMEEATNEGGTFFALDERTNNGANIRLVVAFNDQNPTVDLYCFNVAQVTDPIKKESIYKLLNEKNIDYRFAKFTINEQNSISINTALYFTEDNFDASIITDAIYSLYNAADTEYKTFMKVIWA